MKVLQPETIKGREDVQPMPAARLRKGILTRLAIILAGAGGEAGADAPHQGLRRSYHAPWDSRRVLKTIKRSSHFCIWQMQAHCSLAEQGAQSG
jgi:hypothetical protein